MTPGELPRRPLWGSWLVRILGLPFTMRTYMLAKSEVTASINRNISEIMVRDVLISKMGEGFFVEVGIIEISSGREERIGIEMRV